MAVDEQRFEQLERKRDEEGLTDEEANELGQMMAEKEGEPYSNAADREQRRADEPLPVIADDGEAERGTTVEPGGATEDAAEAADSRRHGRGSPNRPPRPRGPPGPRPVGSPRSRRRRAGTPGTSGRKGNGNLLTITTGTETTTYTYDAVNMVSTLQEPEGSVTNFTYDEDNRPGSLAVSRGARGRRRSRQERGNPCSLEAPWMPRHLPGCPPTCPWSRRRDRSPRRSIGLVRGVRS